MAETEFQDVEQLRNVLESVLDQLQCRGEDLDVSVGPDLPVPRAIAWGEWLDFRSTRPAIGQVWYCQHPTGVGWVVLRETHRIGKRVAWFGRLLETGDLVRVLAVLSGSMR